MFNQREKQMQKGELKGIGKRKEWEKGGVVGESKKMSKHERREIIYWDT